MGNNYRIVCGYNAGKNMLLSPDSPEKRRCNQLTFYKGELDRIANGQTTQKYEPSIASVMNLLALARGKKEHQDIQNSDKIFSEKQQYICNSAQTALQTLCNSKNHHELELLDKEIIQNACKTLCWMSAKVVSEFFIKNGRYDALKEFLRQLDKLIIRMGSNVMDAGRLDGIIKNSIAQLEAARAGA